MKRIVYLTIILITITLTVNSAQMPPTGYAAVTVNVTLSCPADNTSGTVIMLDNTYEEDPSYQITMGAEGTETFQEVLYGSYMVSVIKFGYESWGQGTVTIGGDMTINAGLIKKLTAPSNLKINNKSLLATWSPPVYSETILDENWSGGSLTTNGWTTSGGTNWQMNPGLGNPQPAVMFFWSPQATNYNVYLTSKELTGLHSPVLKLNFDIFLDNYATTTENTMAVELWDGSMWHVLKNYTNQGGNIPWTTESLDISSYTDMAFKIRFHASGGDSYDINYWSIDNISVVASLSRIEQDLCFFGYNFFLNNVLIGTTTDTVFTIPSARVVYGQHFTACVEAVYGNGISNKSCRTFISYFLCPPRQFTVTGIYDATLLTWQEPLCNSGEIKCYEYDDGTMEKGEAFIPGIVCWLGNKMPVPVADNGTITSFKMMWWNNASATNQNFRIDVFSMAGVLLGSSQIFNPPIPAPVGYWSFFLQLEHIIPFTGPFYCMVKWNNFTGDTQWLGYDQNGPNASQNLSYAYDGTTWTPWPAYAGVSPGVFCLQACGIIDGANVAIGPQGIIPDVSATQTMVIANPAIVSQSLESELAPIANPGVELYAPLATGLLEYRIYRSQGGTGGPWAFIGVVIPGTYPPWENPIYYDYNLEPGKWCYRVEAFYNLLEFGFPGQFDSSLPEGPQCVTLNYDQMPFCEDWDWGSFTVNNWSFGTTGQGNWIYNTGVGNPAPGVDFSWAPISTNYSYSLESPAIDASQWTCATIWLDFDYKLVDRNMTSNEKLAIEVYYNNTWHQADELVNNGNLDWTSKHYDISAVQGLPYKFRFRANGVNSADILHWYVDNICTYSECHPPTALAVTQSGLYTTLSWTAPGCLNSGSLSGHNVFRGELIDNSFWSPFVKINVETVTGTNYTDAHPPTTPPGTVFRYYITDIFNYTGNNTVLCEPSSDTIGVYFPFPGDQVVITTAPSSVTASSAISGGHIRWGVLAVLTRGVCWGTSLNPTIDGNHTTVGLEGNRFISTITGLSADSLYHVRAYATVIDDTVYGNDVPFTACPIYTLPYSEEFSTASMPGCWYQVADYPWCARWYFGGNGHAIIAGWPDLYYADLISPLLNLSGFSSVLLNFNHYFKKINSMSATISYSIDNGATWTAIQTFDTTTTNPATFSQYIPAVDGQNQVRFKWSFGKTKTNYYGGTGELWEIHDLLITGDVATISTTQPSSITTTSATSGGNILSDGGSIITARGICWGLTILPTVAGNHTTDGSGTGSFTSSITGLTAGTYYHVRAYATNSNGTVYGNDICFAAACPSYILPYYEGFATASLPNCWTQVEHEINYTPGWEFGVFTGSGTFPALTGNYAFFISDFFRDKSDLVSTLFDLSGYSDVIIGFNHYFETLGAGGAGYLSYSVNDGATWVIIQTFSSTTPNPEIFSVSVPAVAGHNQVRFKWNGSGIIDLWAIDDINITGVIAIPVLSTTIPASITTSAAVSGGNISSGGGGSVSGRGVCWGTSVNPVISGNHTNDGSGIGVFTSNITGLSPGTAYHVRAYATNSTGTYYGNDISFSTPCVIASLPFNEGFATTSQPNCWSQVDNWGEGQVWQFGVITGYGANNPVLTGNYAFLNSDGYGQDYTQDADLISPMMDLTGYVTVNLSFKHFYRSLSTSAATLFYSVNNGASWNIIHTFTATTANPETFSQSIPALAGQSQVKFKWNYSGSFAWYWAIDDIQVTGVGAAILTTTVPSSITTTTAVSGGNIIYTGGPPITARGVCWSIWPEPGISGSHTTDGSGTGTFTSSITGLDANTNYHVRAYATTSSGTYYGNDILFTTVMTSQLLSIPNGWSGISSHIIPANPAVEAIYNPILGNLAITYNMTGIYYPEIPINTIGNWDNNSGYIIKLTEASGLPIWGSEVVNKTVNLNQGWNLIPVLSQQDYNIVSLFAGVPGFAIAKEVAGSGVYWKIYGINSIGAVQPGKAYYVRMNTAGSIDYSIPSDNSSSGKPVEIPALSTPWNTVVNTPASHLVAFNLQNRTFQTGDIVGGFTQEGWCAGVVEITDPSLPFALNLNGDDAYSSEKDGFETGEVLNYQLYRPSTGETFNLEVAYNTEMNPGYFENNGLSEVTSVKISATGISNLDSDNLKVYPNPAKEILIIESASTIKAVEMMNFTGQTVYSNTMIDSKMLQVNVSAFAGGVYFVKITTDEGIRTVKITVTK